MATPRTTLPPVEDDATIEQLGGELVSAAARLIRAVRRANELPAAYRVVSLLDEHGPTGVSDLAGLDRCSQPTMSAAVSQLVERGWVSKTSDSSDARRSVVDLTDAGREELASARARNGATIADWLAEHTDHTPEELAVAVAVLRDLVPTHLPATTP